MMKSQDQWPVGWHEHQTSGSKIEAFTRLLPAGWPQDVPLVRVLTCGCAPLRIEVLHGFEQPESYHGPIYAPPDEATWQAHATKTTLALLAYLASQPHCYAAQDTLAQALRPGRQTGAEEAQEEDEDGALKRPENVVSQLRHLLSPPALRSLAKAHQYALRNLLIRRVTASQESGPGYILAPFPLLWLDVETMETAVKHARMLEQFGESALNAWEQVSSIGLQGVFLPHEPYSDWATWRRARVRELLWQSVEAQVKALGMWEDQQQGEDASIRLLSAYWQTEPTNEDIFRVLAEKLGKRERFQQAEEYYAQLCLTLEREGGEPHQRTRDMMNFVRAMQIQRTFPPPPHGRMLLKQHEGEQNMHVPRRNLIGGLLGMSTSLFRSPFYLDVETLKRLSKVFHASSDLDDMTLARLETITKHHRYEFVQSDGRTWSDIFQEMSGHLRVLTQLLERHIQHPYLCAIAGETTLLLGDLLFNAGESAAADQYYQSAFEVSQGNHLLQAVILGRRALLPIYGHCPQKALPLLDEAQNLLPTTAADMIGAYLWSVKGEAYASLGEANACYQALHTAERLVERERPGEISLHFQPEIASATFDRTKFFGYQGICLIRLHREEKAQDVLYDQLLRVEERALIHQQSIASVDLAVSFVQQAAIRQAYEYATKALKCVEETRSGRVFQRILELRRSLNPWLHTTYIKNLDEYIQTITQDLLKGVQ